MYKALGAAAVVVCLTVVSAEAGEFVGSVEFTQPGCEKDGLCVLKSDFGYKDSSGAGWQAKAGNKTDGASIPPKLQPYIGYSFDEDLIRAAVIHDHYCDRHVKSWSETHWVFYDALLASGVEKRRAQKMYAGVLLGGPKWIWLMVGEKCPLLDNCVMQAPTAALPAGGYVKTLEDGRSVFARPSRYNTPEFARELQQASEAIDKLASSADRPEIEALAKSLRPADGFLRGPQSIVLRVPLSGTK